VWLSPLGCITPDPRIDPPRLRLHPREPKLPLIRRSGSVNLWGRDSLRYHCGYMGLFHVGCRVLNPATSKSTVVRRLVVDTGAESTWIDAAVLEAIGIEPRKKDLQFQLTNGQIVTRSVGYAVLRVDKAETVDEVVFAQRGDLQLLGARALEGLNLQVDSRRKRLVAAQVRSSVPPPCLRDSGSWCRSFRKLQRIRESPGRTGRRSLGLPDPKHDEWRRGT